MRLMLYNKAGGGDAKAGEEKSYMAIPNARI